MWEALMTSSTGFECDLNEQLIGRHPSRPVDRSGLLVLGLRLGPIRMRHIPSALR